MIVALARKLLIALWAPGDHWRGSGWRHIASSVLEGRNRTKISSRSLTNRTSSVSITIRGGGSPEAGHGVDTGFENGPAAPELRAGDAHDCIMVRSLWTYRIQGCGAMIRGPMASSPRTVSLSRFRSLASRSARRSAPGFRTSPNHRSTESKISVDRKRPIQGTRGKGDEGLVRRALWGFECRECCA